MQLLSGLYNGAHMLTTELRRRLSGQSKSVGQPFDGALLALSISIVAFPEQAVANALRNLVCLLFGPDVQTQQLNGSRVELF